MLQESIAIKNNVLSLPFQAANVPDAAGSMITLNADNTEYPPMTHAGSIIGLSVRHNADLSGGVITWTPTVNGTPVTGISVVTDDTHQQAYISIRSEAVRFAAGDRLGIAWTKTGTVAPTTTDVVAQLIVLSQDMEF